MTHEVLPHVIDYACLDGSKDDARRMMWRLEVLLESYVIYIYIYSCMYSWVLPVYLFS